MSDDDTMTSPTAPDRPRRRRPASAGQTIRCLALALALLVVLKGDAVGPTARELSPGVPRSVLAAVGAPTGWVADHLPFAAATEQVQGWLSPDGDDAGSPDGSFAVAEGSGPSRVPPQAFDPGALGEPPTRRPLRSLLVTGDSMSQPLDAQLARDLAGDGVRTVRDVHLGSGISKPFIVDWGRLAGEQTAKQRPDAVVVFLGANEGFPMRVRGREVRCCDPAWAAEYATRARAMMDVYRRGGATKVLWTLLPIPRDAERARIARTVNLAIGVAAGGFGAQVAVVDAAGIFTPRGRFRDAMTVDGRERVVRRADGIHLNDDGAGVLAGVIERDLRARFGATPE